MERAGETHCYQDESSHLVFSLSVPAVVPGRTGVDLGSEGEFL